MKFEEHDYCRNQLRAWGLYLVESLAKRSLIVFIDNTGAAY